MIIFVTPDRQHYRRWLNGLVSLLLPGAGHFLTGRKVAALGWFLAHLLSIAVVLWFVVWPGSDYILGNPGLPEQRDGIVVFCTTGIKHPPVPPKVFYRHAPAGRKRWVE
jgi:hypothetical protein